MLKQDAMTPLYVQLMDTVEKDIKSGRYKPGDKIMTESEMAKTYGVSLITVRKAIGSLMEKGLVVRKQGKGRRNKAKIFQKYQTSSELQRDV